MAIVVDKNKCVGCGLCDLLCPDHAFVVSEFFVAEVVEDQCVYCLECLDYCPNDAISDD